jgi:hypothetical protein
MLVRKPYLGVLSGLVALSLVIVSSGLAATARAAAAPAITGFTPKSGPVGTKVYITGTNFAGATSVQFNGVSADSFSVNDAGTYITATVPTEAAPGANNPISVTTPSGIAMTTTGFNITSGHTGIVAIPKPRILSFTPKHGKAGTTLKVTGMNFAGALVVRLGGVKATFRVPSSTKILLTVPGNAKSGKISVKTRGGIAISSIRFTVLST